MKLNNLMSYKTALSMRFAILSIILVTAATVSTGQLILVPIGGVPSYSITGSWYQTDIEYEVHLDQAPELRIRENESLTITDMGGGDFSVQLQGEEADTISLTRNGNRWSGGFTDTHEESGNTTAFRVEIHALRSDLVLVNQVRAVYAEHGRIVEAEANVSVLTRAPIADLPDMAWPGVWFAHDLGHELMSGSEIEFMEDPFTVRLHAMARNTFQLEVTEEDSTERLNLVQVGNRLQLSLHRTYDNYIEYEDLDWRVRITSERDTIRVIPIGNDTFFVAGFSLHMGLLEAIDPAAHGNFTPEPRIQEMFVSALIFERQDDVYEPVSPLASGCIGALLAEHAQQVAGSEWFFIPWLGFLTPLGADFAYMAGLGNLFFGADCDEDSNVTHYWIFIHSLGKWFAFSPEYEVTAEWIQAWDPELGEIVTINLNYVAGTAPGKRN